MDKSLNKLIPSDELKEVGNVDMIAEPSRNVPKFCTLVKFTSLASGEIVMQFLHSMDNVNNILIESIIVQEAHAKKIVETLHNVINQGEK